MPVITISRGSYSHGKQVAEMLSAKLGYECVSREIILNASKHFNTPEIKLMRALHDAPSSLDRITYGKERYIAFFQEALLRCLLKDNVIYHGLAGHFFVKDVSHALKVRIVADLDERLTNEMERDNVSREKALRLLKSDDEERRKWSLELYGIDTNDPGWYDLIVHIGIMSPEDAVEMIAKTVSQPSFQATAASRKAIETRMLAARVQVLLLETMPSAKVSIEEGEIVVSGGGYWGEEKKLIARVDGAVDCEKAGLQLKLRSCNAG